MEPVRDSHLLVAPPPTVLGALYTLIGDRDVYVEAAARSARSLRRAMPDLPIAIATDRRTLDGPFDHYIQLREPDGFRAKILGLRQTPFEETVMLDVDTYILAADASAVDDRAPALAKVIVDPQAIGQRRPSLANSAGFALGGRRK